MYINLMSRCSKVYRKILLKHINVVMWESPCTPVSGKVWYQSCRRQAMWKWYRSIKMNNNESGNWSIFTDFYKFQEISQFAQKVLDIGFWFVYNSRPQTMSRLKKRRRRLRVEALKNVWDHWKLSKFDTGLSGLGVNFIRHKNNRLFICSF